MIARHSPQTLTNLFVSIVSRPLVWPLQEKDEKLPEELFNQICTYLPRSDIYNMRLVNKVFEAMISPHLFKYVVVPFKAGIYGPEIDIAGLRELLSGDGSKKKDVIIEDEGMRVFAGYGQRISKFAMSFEYDEQKLNYPPLKSDQEAITSFWGIYRWPHKQYNRFAQLAHLEQIADETNTLSTALKCITQANTLGLSIDSGLGWLLGPDNRVCKARASIYKVFGANRFVPEPFKLVANEHKFPLPVFNSEDMSRERMLKEAGLEGEELGAAIDLMRKTENPGEVETSSQSDEFLLVFPRNSQSLETPSAQSSEIQLMPSQEAIVTLGTSFSDGNGNMSTSLVLSDEDRAGVASQIRVGPSDRPLSADGPNSQASNTWPLEPANLTAAQKEVLLETMWAQQAFVQSYIISITDNSQVFSKVATLIIARIPDHFLQDLNREDFWNSLSSLETLHLGVIPSWRRVEKLATTYVQDSRVAPSLSIEPVYSLLNSQIAKRQNIKTLRFEWLCGGEEAPGMLARNSHILAAPVVSTSVEMLDTTIEPTILALPFIKHLTLKNCWFSPHILESFLEGFGEATVKNLKLQNLVFDSVSLTAPIPTNTVVVLPTFLPADLQAAQINALPVLNLAAPPLAVAQAANVAPGAFPALNNAAGQAVGAGGPNADSDAEDNDDLSEPSNFDKYQPRHGSWAEIMEQLTPSHYKSLSYRKQDARGSDTALSRPKPPLIRSLRNLEFHSCGYVQLPLDIDQSMLRAPLTDRTRRLVQAAKADIEDVMLKPNDFTLGAIINRMDSIERWQLVNGYFLSTGWDEYADFSTRVYESHLDGIRRPGQGRFTGSIHATDVKP